MTLPGLVIRNRGVYDNEYHNFKRIFGVSLKVYWDNVTGFELVSFDENFIKAPDGESMEDVIQEKYGYEGVRIVKALIFYEEE